MSRSDLARLLLRTKQQESILSRIPEHDPLEFGAAALKLLTARHELLGANLVNADTPNFKARDFSFATELSKQLGGVDQVEGVSLHITHSEHIGFDAGNGNAPHMLYRIPVQPSVDGNTVDPDIERTHFIKNAMLTQSALGFLSSTIRTRLSAITGQAS
jgi:flagellar basal-body rod protein FlgB